MKKLITLLMLVVCGVGMGWAQDKTYDLSTWSTQTIPESAGATNALTVDGLTYYGGTGSAYASGDKTFEDKKTFTGRIKLGGKSTIKSNSNLSRLFSFTITKDCIIKVYAVHGSSSGDPRTVYMTQKITSTDRDASAAIASCATPAGGAGILEGKASAGTVYIWADNNVGIYAITVTEYIATKCTEPTVKQEGFNFEKHEYPVVFTAKSGETLHVSVDGAPATEMVSPATVYPRETASAYTTAEGLENSETVQVTALPNNFDNTKPYIAWVYTSTYASVSGGFESDKILNGLKENYNVVLVDYADGTTPAEDLKNADVIISTEAMAGGKTMSNGLKNFVGVTPMVNFKMFNYTSGRWSWGSPKNPGASYIGITPTSKHYKLLEGTTTEADGSINFYTADNDASKNHIQTVEFSATAPESNIVMGTTAGNAAMHCADKFFGIGLSSDDWAHYSDNAVTIIKNAVAMLIAGEPLDTQSYTLAAKDGYYHSLYLNYNAVIPEGVTAYTGTLNSEETTINLTKIDGNIIPANTGVVVKADAAGDKVFEETSETATMDAGSLKGVLAETMATELAQESKVVLTLGINSDGAFGFRKPAGGKIGANKIYLLVSEAAAAKGISMSFDDETTGISEVNTENADNNAATYDLTGRRVNAGAKGLLIRNGKKFIVK